MYTSCTCTCVCCTVHVVQVYIIIVHIHVHIQYMYMYVYMYMYTYSTHCWTIYCVIAVSFFVIQISKLQMKLMDACNERDDALRDKTEVQSQLAIFETNLKEEKVSNYVANCKYIRQCITIACSIGFACYYFSCLVLLYRSLQIVIFKKNWNWSLNSSS